MTSYNPLIKIISLKCQYLTMYADYLTKDGYFTYYVTDSFSSKYEQSEQNDTIFIAASVAINIHFFTV